MLQVRHLEDEILLNYEGPDCSPFRGRIITISEWEKNACLFLLLLMFSFILCALEQCVIKQDFMVTLQ